MQGRSSAPDSYDVVAAQQNTGDLQSNANSAPAQQAATAGGLEMSMQPVPATCDTAGSESQGLSRTIVTAKPAATASAASRSKHGIVGKKFKLYQPADYDDQGPLSSWFPERAKVDNPPRWASNTMILAKLDLQPEVLLGRSR